MTCPHCPTGPNEGYSSGAVNYKSLWTLGKPHTCFMVMMWQMAIDNMIVENLSALSKPCSPSLFSVPCVYLSRVSHSLFEGVCLYVIYFIFGCTVSLLQCVGFLQLWHVGAVLTAVRGPLIVVGSCCRIQALVPRLRQF